MCIARTNSSFFLKFDIFIWEIKTILWKNLILLLIFLLNFVNSLSIFRRVSVIFNLDFSHLSLKLKEKKKKYAKEKIL